MGVLIFSGSSWNTSILFLLWMNSRVGCSVFPCFLHDVQWLVLPFVCFFDCWEFWFLGLLQFLLLLGFLITPTEVCFLHFLSILSFSWENLTLHNERPKLDWFSFLCFSFVFFFSSGFETVTYMLQVRAVSDSIIYKNLFLGSQTQQR